jgi:hypothetical protein
VPAVVKQSRDWWRPPFELVAVVLVVLAGLVFVLWPGPWASAENFARVRPGMTLAEVEAIVGPPGEFTSQPDDLRGQRWWERDGHHPTPESGTFVEWKTDVSRAVVFFDAGGRVVDLVYYAFKKAGRRQSLPSVNPATQAWPKGGSPRRLGHDLRTLA